MAKNPAKKTTTKAAAVAKTASKKAPARTKAAGDSKITKLEPAETKKYILGHSQIFTPR
ncbi:MAG: hypothetical protein R3D33_00685 [Hyphomicrobiaceae bacterium]